MKLHKLEVCNWRTLYGKQAPIEFSTDSNRPITILHGCNHSGKTNLVNALLWLFNPKQTTSNFKVNQGIVHSRALAELTEGEEIECYIKLRFSHRGKLHDATRSVNRQYVPGETSVPLETDTNLVVMVQSDDGGWAEQQLSQTKKPSLR